MKVKETKTVRYSGRAEYKQGGEWRQAVTFAKDKYSSAEVKAIAEDMYPYLYSGLPVTVDGSRVRFQKVTTTTRVETEDVDE